MFRLFCFSFAVFAACLCESSASAQYYHQGYQFGAGLQALGGGNFGCFHRPYSFTREQPPYFAMFPPVYYSHIVPRPYGISPYAVPPGIAPVEMSVPAAVPHPVSIKNPYYPGSVKSAQKVAEPKVEPAVDQTKSEEPGKTKTTYKKITNPFYVESDLKLVERN